MTETYYERLGVSPDATTDEIEAAYRERLKETHPDVSDAEDASDRTRALIDAKEVLTDEDERARYDRLGHEQYVAAEETDAGTTAETSSTARPSPDESAPQDFSTSAAAQQRATVGDASGKTTGGGTDAGTTNEYRRRQRRRHDQQAPRDSWNSGDGTVSSAGEKAWRAWDTGGTYSVNNGDAGQGWRRVFGSGQSLVLLAATFVLYPLLLWAALLPDFPLAVNATVGACVLALVAYMQSIPEVGIVVYGAWTVLLPLILNAVGVELTQPLVGVALAATVLSLGFTLLTRAVVR